MKYESAAAFRTALEQRLRKEAEETGLGLARLRKRVAFELFLRRLVEVAPNRWVLKGALALDLRLDATTRPTKDIDLGRDDDEESATQDIAAAQRLDLDDFFTFAATRTDAFDEADEFQAIRFRVRAELAERVFERFIVDIGFTDSIAWTPDTIRTSNFLSFADIAPVDLPAIPFPQHVAEKLHAYSGTYGSSERASTRPKDLVDLLLIAGSEQIEASALGAALTTTFGARDRQPLPAQLPNPPPEWQEPYRRLAEEVGIEPDLGAASASAAAFLDPVLAGRIDGHWDPKAWAWTAPSDMA